MVSRPKSSSEKSVLGDEGLRCHTPFRSLRCPHLMFDLAVLEGLQQHAIAVSRPSRRTLVVARLMRSGSGGIARRASA